MEQPKRRLSAVWFADIVGYSELSGHDEPAALALVDLLQSLCREILPSHEGRIVKFIGDACLAEFASTDSAVRSAVALEQRFVADSTAAGQPGSLRIGVHLGEVTATPDGDLYGDGINTASRLQHTASPGQVIISEDVWRQLRQRPEFRFAPLGSVELRGITTEVLVYDVLFGSRAAVAPQSAAAPAATPTAAATGGSNWKVPAAIAALIVVGVAIWAFASLGQPGADPTQSPPAVTQNTPSSPAPAPSSPPPPSATPERSALPDPPKPAPTATQKKEPAATPDPAPAAPDPNGRGGRAGRAMLMAQFPPAEGRALVQRLADAVSSGASPETFASIGPGVAQAAFGRGSQAMKEGFGPGLSIRVGRVDPIGPPVNGRLPIKFILLARSNSRPETPLVFVAGVERDASGQMKIMEIARDLPGRRGR